MAGFGGAMPTPINPNSAPGIRDILDVPSNQEMKAAIAQSTAVVSTTLSSSGHPNIDTTKPFNVSVIKTGKICFARIFSIVPATSASGWSDIITLPSGYTPNWDMNIVLYDDTAGKAVEARMYSDNGTLRIYAPVAGHSYWGTAVYVTA